MKTIFVLLSWMPEVQRMLHDKSVTADTSRSFSQQLTHLVIPRG